MRILLLGLPTFVAALACVAPATAQSATVRGLLVDEFCSRTAKPHDNHDNKTQAEMESCALECAGKGDPVDAKLIPHMNRTVEITGEVTEQRGKRQIDADVVKSVK